MTFAPLIVAVVAGITIGVARGGHVSALRRVRIHSPLLVVVAVASGSALDHYDIAIASLIAVIGIVAGVGFAVRNIHLAGMAIIGVGIVANLLPVVINGAVPVRGDALVEAGMIDPIEIPELSLNGSRELTDDSTILSVLGDTIPVSSTNQVVSYGDLILLVGLADVIANGMKKRRRRQRNADEFDLSGIWSATSAAKPNEPATTSDAPDQGIAITNDDPARRWDIAPSSRPVS